MTDLKYFEFKGSLYTLAILQFLIAIGGLIGGVFLLMGNGATAAIVSQDLYELNPMATYIAPGIGFLLLIALPSLLAGYLTIRRVRYFGLVSILMGILFLSWNYFHFVTFGLFSLVQPIYLVLSIAIILMGLFFLARMDDKEYRELNMVFK